MERGRDERNVEYLKEMIGEGGYSEGGRVRNKTGANSISGYRDGNRDERVRARAHTHDLTQYA